MEFRDLLVNARKEKGYNQESLAEKIGVSRQAVSKWETGDAQPALSQLIALADALDISLDVLCGRIDPDAPTSAATSPAPAGSDPTGAASSTSTAAPITDDTKRQTEYSVSLKIAFLPLLLAVLIVAGMFFHMSSAIAEAEEAALKKELPDTIEVTGLMFYGDSVDNMLQYEFTPSIINSDWTYTINFIDFDRQVHSFEVKSDNGIFHGYAKLPGGDLSYTVTLEISNGEESRAVALATGLTFDETQASWNPVTSIVEP